MTRISQTVDFFFLVLLTFFIVFNLLARNWLANNSEVGVCKKQKYKSRWGDESFFFVGVGWLTSSLFSSSVSTFIYMVKIVALILESGSVLEIIALDFSWRKKYTALSVSVSENKIYPPPPQVVFYTCVNHLPSLSSTCLVTFLTSASTAPSMQNNSIFHDLKSDEVELLYSAYGDETGIQCALR